LRLESFARRQRFQALHVLGDRAEIAETHAGRDGAARLQFVAVHGFLGFDDDVVDAEKVDVTHHFLLRAGRDRKHRHNGADAKDHTEHRKQTAELVNQQARQAHLNFGQNVGNHRHWVRGS